MFQPASIAISDCMMRLGFAFENGYEDFTVLCGAVITSSRGTGSGVSAQRVFTSRAPLDHQAVLTLAAESMCQPCASADAYKTLPHFAR
jgi:hypothetical protein